MHVTGACHCGGITFEADINERKIIICHCADCQILSSSAFRVGALVPRSSFHLQGATSEYSKIGTTGAERRMVFCPVCSTNIYAYQAGSENTFISLRLGAVKNFSALKPSLQIWRNSALPWVGQVDNIRSCAEQEGMLAALSEIARGCPPT